MKRERLIEAIKDGYIEVRYGDIETSKRVEITVNHSGSVRQIVIEN